MKKYIKYSFVLAVAVLVLLLSGCNGSKFNVNDVKVSYEYMGTYEDYEIAKEQYDITDSQKVVEYVIHIDNTSDYMLDNVCRKPVVNGDNYSEDYEMQIKEWYTTIDKNSEDTSFPIRLVYDKSVSDEEIYNEISQKKDVVTFNVDDTRYERTGSWLAYEK